VREDGAMSNPVIVSAKRTPIAKLLGSLASFKASDLGGVAIEAALAQAGIAGSEVDHVVMGQVLLAGTGQLPARQAAAAAGIPLSVPASIVNKVCPSGLYAIHHASLLLRAGEANVVVAGGQESMSNAPHLLPGARRGIKYGNSQVIDSLMFDALWCAFDDCVMGDATEKYADAMPVSRARQDELAAASHARAAAAWSAGRFTDEVVPMQLDRDEGIRDDTTVDKLAGLKGVFGGDQTITAGNASQISDGGAALVVMTADEAQHRGMTPLAEIVAYGQVAGPTPSLLHQPSNAINAALARADLKVGDLSLIEINEAFAAVAAASIDALGVSEDIVNVNGGAIAIGHPVGMTGARIAMTLMYELQRRGGGYGAAALCGGGGQGDAIILKV